jgi:hypothetical protein
MPARRIVRAQGAFTPMILVFAEQFPDDGAGMNGAARAITS